MSEYVPMFPKPCQVKKEPVAIKVFPDGREKINLLCKEGRDIYSNRKREMHDRQNGICCLHGVAPGCPGRLALKEAMFEHEDGRTSGHYDDRIWVTIKGKRGRKNGVAHPACNSWKGSRRIPYNEHEEIIP